MKKTISFLSFLLCSVVVLAQAPQKFSYQGVARDNAGNLLTSTDIGIKFDIHQYTVNGTVVYSERQTHDTNAFGVFTLEAGNGNPQLGTFSAIDWSDGPYYLEVSMDPLDGINYQSLGTSQLMSVPYALYAETSGSGPVGATGPQGSSGTDGTNGVDGATGPQGPSGVDGTNGVDGATGPQGPTGADGANGVDGATGPQGTTGADGTNGVDGATGPTGPQGPMGADDEDWVVSGNNQYSAVGGNVGIGTGLPIATLHVSGGPRTLLLSNNAATNAGLEITTGVIGIGESYTRMFFREEGSSSLWGFSMGFNGGVENDILNWPSNSFVIAGHHNDATGTPFLTIPRGSGNIGIATTTPQEKLHVIGSIQMEDSNEQSGFIPVSDTNGKMTWTDPTTVTTSSDGDWTISGTDQYSAVSGNVGIGTTAPTAKLEITTPASGTTLRLGRYSGDPSIEATGQASASDWLIADGNVSNNGNAALNFYSGGDVILANGGGNVGVGNSLPSSKLHVEDSFAGAGLYTATIENTGNVAYSNGLEIKAGQNTQTVNNRMISFVKPNGTEIGSVRQTSSSGVGYNTTSDLRLKTNIQPTAKGLEDLLQIEVKDYVYKEDLEKPQTGFIAQQIYEHYPNAVTPGGEDVKTDPWMMDYGKLTPLLVKAVQDQQKMIEILKKEIEELKADR